MGESSIARATLRRFLRRYARRGAAKLDREVDAQPLDLETANLAHGLVGEVAAMGVQPRYFAGARIIPRLDRLEGAAQAGEIKHGPPPR